MLVLRNWLQTYFKEMLPSDEDIAHAFTFHAFEIDGIEKKDNDTIFDVKVLPDRNHYALSHRGMAYELAAILKRERIIPKQKEYILSKVSPLSIQIEATEFCERYISRRIENVRVGESSAQIKTYLEAVGSRSINSVVDATNFVMLDVGQPLHAFDADRVEGSIKVRFAKEDEQITTLDGKEIKLGTDMMIVADDRGPLAIAGVKGGKRAEVTTATKNIILEAACFDASSVRKTSLKVGIRNESSKRFENQITPVFAEVGMEQVTALIASFSPEARVGEMIDIYEDPQEQTTIELRAEYISEVLGISISQQEIIDILKRLEIDTEITDEKTLKFHIPAERLDLVAPQDIVEEVGRLYGYDTIPLKNLPPLSKSAEVNPYFYYNEQIKNFLIQRGFSEVFTYSLSAKGDFEIEKSASDKNFVRTNLTDGIAKSVETNVYYAPLLNLSQIKIFEIGKVFKKTGESLNLCVAISNTKNYKGEKVNDEIKKVRDELFDFLQLKVQVVCTVDDTGGLLNLNGKDIGEINNTEGIMEINLGALIDSLPKPASYQKFNSVPDITYAPLSSYPFVLRDIAVFVPGEAGRDAEILNMIRETAGALLVTTSLFDIFTKKPKGMDVAAFETKTSYAFRLVFQSKEKTLTDEEINTIMQKVTDMLNSQPGFEVR